MAGSLPLDGSVVKLRGIPYKALREDVELFFSGFKIVPDGILMRKNPDGRLHGEAFVIFEDPEEASRATSKDREVFSEKSGDRFIRVYPTTDMDHADMRSIVVSGSFYTIGGPSDSPLHNSVVKVRSLPDTAKQIDVINFFSDFTLKPNGVQLIIGASGRCVGDAYVDFETLEDAQRAVSTKDRGVLGGKFGDRFVLLSISSRKEMRETLGQTGAPGFIKMKGLPYKATPADVESFFAGYGVNSVHIMRGDDGRATGMAVVEFDSADEANRSMEKNKAVFNPAYGERFVTFQVISATDAKNQLSRIEFGTPGAGGMGMAGNMMAAGTPGRMGNGMASGMGPMRAGGGMGPMSKMGMGGMVSPMMAGGGMGLGMSGMGMTGMGMMSPMTPGMGGMGMGAMGGGMGAMGGGMGMGMSPAASAPNGPMSSQRPAASQGGPAGQQGVQQSTAPGWQATIDPASGVVYYQNMVTGERSWTDPLFSNK